MSLWPRCPLLTRLVKRSLDTAYNANCRFITNLTLVKLSPHVSSFHTRRAACTSLFATKRPDLVVRRTCHPSRTASSVSNYVNTSRGPVPGSEPGVDASDEDAIWPQSRQQHIQVCQSACAFTVYPIVSNPRSCSPSNGSSTGG